MKEQNRLCSLDFMRGLIMVLLMLESTELYFHLQGLAGGSAFFSALMEQFFHNNWEGLHFWDLVQPAFMFIAGVSMAFSLAHQESAYPTKPWLERFVKIAKRSSLLLFWGIFKRVSSPDWLHLSALDLTDVLTQMAFTTLIVFFLSEWKIKWQVLMAFLFLLLTEAIYRIPHIPNLIDGYTDGVNTGSYIDWILFGQAHNHYVFINWLPTAVHTLVGLIVGRLIIGQHKSGLAWVMAGGGLSLALGYGLDYLMITPIIKPIASTAFVLASLGYCMLFLAGLHYWIDKQGHNKGLDFFRIVGMNSIFIYLFCDIVGRGWLNAYAGIIFSPLEVWGLSHLAMLTFSALVVFALEWYLCYLLYQKKIFFKL